MTIDVSVTTASAIKTPPRPVQASVAGSAPSKRRPIHQWLRWLAVACIVPAWAATAFLITRSYERERETLRSGTQVTARTLMQAVDGKIAGMESALWALATSPALTESNFAAFHIQAQQVQATQTAANIVLVTPSGRQIVNTLRPFGTTLPENGSTGKLMRVFATGKPAISDLFVGPVAQRPVVGIQVPVIRDGKIVYGLAMGAFPERISEVLKQQNPPADWIISIFDSTGTIVARTRAPEQFVGKQGSSILLRRMTEVAEDVIEAPTLEGIQVLAAFSRSALSGWSVAIGVPIATLNAGLRQSLWFSVAVAIALLLLGVLAARAISNRIVRSIRALSQPALALASGNMVSLPAIEIDEVAEVGTALLDASQRLARREADRAAVAAAEQQAAVAERVAARLQGLLEAAPDPLILVRIRPATLYKSTIVWRPTVDLVAMETATPSLRVAVEYAAPTPTGGPRIRDSLGGLR